MQERNKSIDHLRGIAILVMLLTHSLAVYLGSNSLVDFLWDKSHFAVPMFVFCSSFLFFNREIEKPIHHIVPYVKKRLIRLLKPYYIFLFVNTLLLFVFRPQIVTKEYVFQSITLTGGVDINWLVLLFIQFIPVFLLIRYLLHKNKTLFYLYGVSAFVSTCILLFYQPSAISYKLYMWLPWSTVLFFAYLFMHSNTKRKVILTLLAWATYTACFFILTQLHQTTNLFQNKYPPNLYYLSYGLALTPLFIFLSVKGAFSFRPLDRTITYASTYSYDFFFIHYIIIEIMTIFILQKWISWPIFFMVVVTLTYLTQMLFTKGLQTVHRSKKS